MTSKHATPADWFEKHFNADYLLLYSERSLDEAREQVAFLRHILELDRPRRILDLCCGAARHLRALLEAGCDAVGVDLSATLLEHAAEYTGLRGRLIRADMRNLPFADGSFERVLCFFTSFGYFDSHAEHLHAAAEIRRVLAPGGRFALDLMNRDQVVEQLVPSSARELGDHRIEETRRYDREHQRVEKTIRLVDTRSGEIREYRESVRTFARDEVSALLEAAGLEVDAVFGDFAGSRFRSSSPRMLLIGSAPRAVSAT